MPDLIVFLRKLSFVSLVICIGACEASSSKPSSADFDTLCNIFIDVEEEYKKNEDLAMSRAHLIQKIQTEIPNMYDDFHHVFNTIPEEKYQLYQEIAQVRINKKWDCPAAQSFYSRM